MILETASSMLDEMPVSAMSLNELSRRVGLAKSNVLRYFESREAVLLDLLDTAARQWLVGAAAHIPVSIDQSLSVQRRVDAVSAEFAAAFAAAPALCELLSVEAGVLDQNVSTEVALRYKRGTHESQVGFAGLLEQVLPELGPGGGDPAARLITVLVAALWTRTHPPEAVVEAYDTDPSLAQMSPEFAQVLEQYIAICLSGLLVRQAPESS